MGEYDYDDMDYNMNYADHSTDINDTDHYGGFADYEPGLNLHYSMYAQVADKTLEEQQQYEEDPHDLSLKESIDQNRNDFNNMIEQEILAEFYDNLIEDVDEADQHLEEIKAMVEMEGNEAYQELCDHIDSLIEIMMADN
jgi:hypothetical protein